MIVDMYKPRAGSIPTLLSPEIKLLVSFLYCTPEWAIASLLYSLYSRSEIVISFSDFYKSITILYLVTAVEVSRLNQKYISHTVLHCFVFVYVLLELWLFTLLWFDKQVLIITCLCTYNILVCLWLIMKLHEPIIYG